MTESVKLGRYTVLKPLASGGMADLLLARAEGIAGFERHVVIKRVRSDQASDPQFVEMFVTEARLAATLHHANIVQVHDIGQEGGLHYFAMEYIHGEDARKFLHRHKQTNAQVPVAHILTIGIGVASALHHAHEQRGPDRKPLDMVHRDVTPGNILIGYDGSVKLVDFGIAKAVRTQVTQVGQRKGKSAYMSPEQCQGQTVDRRSDVFSLGIVLYELATVRRLFKGQSDFATMNTIVSGMVPSPAKSRPDLPEALVEIIMKALSRDRARRYQTAEEMRIELDALTKQHGGGSSSSLMEYMKATFGSPPEPWLVEGEIDVPSIDFDGSASGVATEPAVATTSTKPEAPIAIAKAAEAPKSTMTIPPKPERKDATPLPSVKAAAATSDAAKPATAEAAKPASDAKPASTSAKPADAKPATADAKPAPAAAATAKSDATKSEAAAKPASTASTAKPDAAAPTAKSEKPAATAASTTAKSDTSAAKSDAAAKPATTKSDATGASTAKSDASAAKPTATATSTTAKSDASTAKSDAKSDATAKPATAPTAKSDATASTAKSDASAAKSDVKSDAKSDAAAKPAASTAKSDASAAKPAATAASTAKPAAKKDATPVPGAKTSPPKAPPGGKVDVGDDDKTSVSAPPVDTFPEVAAAAAEKHALPKPSTGLKIEPKITAETSGFEPDALPPTPPPGTEVGVDIQIDVAGSIEKPDAPKPPKEVGDETELVKPLPPPPKAAVEAAEIFDDDDDDVAARPDAKRKKLILIGMGAAALIAIIVAIAIASGGKEPTTVADREKSKPTKKVDPPPPVDDKPADPGSAAAAGSAEPAMGSGDTAGTGIDTTGTGTGTAGSGDIAIDSPDTKPDTKTDEKVATTDTKTDAKTTTDDAATAKTTGKVNVGNKPNISTTTTKTTTPTTKTTTTKTTTTPKVATTTPKPTTTPTTTTKKPATTTTKPPTTTVAKKPVTKPATTTTTTTTKDPKWDPNSLFLKKKPK